MAGANDVTIEVFADAGCPFTHVGLKRLVGRRTELGRDDVRLKVRSWPLEIINGSPLEPGFVAAEVDEIRRQVAPDLFAGFDRAAFPATSLPAMSLSALGYQHSLEVGERVSLELRDRLFERGEDIADPDVLARVARAHGLDPGAICASAVPTDHPLVLADHELGVQRGVVGSPDFFIGEASFFCPALDISHGVGGELVIAASPEGFDSFLAACFG